MLTSARVLLLVLLLPALASAQTAPVKNPTKAIFTSPDAASVTGYEVDIIGPTGTVVQTLTFPATAPDANGDVTLTLNVQPVAFGVYTAVVRAVSAGLKSVNSEPSNTWERVPGQPSKPKVQ